MISSPMTAFSGLAVTLMLRSELEASAADEIRAKTSANKRVDIFIRLSAHWLSERPCFWEWRCGTGGDITGKQKIFFAGSDFSRVARIRGKILQRALERWSLGFDDLEGRQSESYEDCSRGSKRLKSQEEESRRSKFRPCLRLHADRWRVGPD